MKLNLAHWRDLAHGKAYEIKNYVVFEDIDRLRLVLKDLEGKEYSLWAPDCVRYVIQGEEFTHLRSYGKVNGRWKFDIERRVTPSPLCS